MLHELNSYTNILHLYWDVLETEINSFLTNPTLSLLQYILVP